MRIPEKENTHDISRHPCQLAAGRCVHSTAVMHDLIRDQLWRQGHQDPLRRPRGVMLLSPFGCGKSQFAKSLGNETGRPTLILDVGSLMGSLVGSIEANIRRALKIIDAMAPCVCLIDFGRVKTVRPWSRSVNRKGRENRLSRALISTTRIAPPSRRRLP